MWGRTRKEAPITEAQLRLLVTELDRGMWRHVRAFRVLVRQSNPEAGEFFIRTFETHPSKTVRASMLHLLPRADAARRIDLVYRGLGDRETAVRMVAVSILEKEGGTTALTPLADAFWQARKAQVTQIPGEGGAGFECPHFAEFYVAGRCAEAIAAISLRGPATARSWALAFLQDAWKQWPEASEKFQLAFRRVERAVAKDLSNPTEISLPHDDLVPEPEQFSA